jgi:hypothetical protein
MFPAIAYNSANVSRILTAAIAEISAMVFTPTAFYQKVIAFKHFEVQVCPSANQFETPYVTGDLSKDSIPFEVPNHLRVVSNRGRYGCAAELEHEMRDEIVAFNLLGNYFCLPSKWAISEYESKKWGFPVPGLGGVRNKQHIGEYRSHPVRVIREREVLQQAIDAQLYYEEYKALVEAWNAFLGDHPGYGRAARAQDHKRVFGMILCEPNSDARVRLVSEEEYRYWSKYHMIPSVVLLGASHVNLITITMVFVN